MIATHYDTRSTADRDPDETRRSEPIIGANDGASGVAVLLEMAELWKEQPPPVGVDLIEDRGGLVFDDHTAFLDNGIPVILLIDFKDQWFHTTADTPDKCAPESLGQVGRVVMEAVEAP